jgi:2-C-methyl-D-erythritol 2,4-cyclodiphosphate synthase
MFRVGIGYDVHRLVRGRKLVLGGVTLPFAKGLSGHSDADVLVHAICDALLGAVGAEDIGSHFPDKDPKYKDISSLILLEKVRLVLDKKGFCVHNVDTMVLLEQPKLSVFKERMKKKIASALKVSSRQVSIKATTHEGIGAIGRGEAAAATAVVLVRNRRKP